MGLTSRKWGWSLLSGSPGGSWVRVLRWLCSRYWGFPTCCCSSVLLCVCGDYPSITQPKKKLIWCCSIDKQQKQIHCVAWFFFFFQNRANLIIRSYLTLCQGALSSAWIKFPSTPCPSSLRESLIYHFHWTQSEGAARENQIIGTTSSIVEVSEGSCWDVSEEL